MNLGAVTATTDYDGQGQPIHVPLTEGTVTDGVAVTASFRLFFDRFLLPSRATRQAVCLRPRVDAVATSADCNEPSQSFTEPEYDPVLREVRYRVAGSLSPDTVYRLTVLQTSDPDPPVPDVGNAGITAFDGAPLARAYTFDFRTRPAGGPEIEEKRPSPQRYCASLPCFRQCDDQTAPCYEACAFADGTCRGMCSTANQSCLDACTDDSCRAACNDQEQICADACTAADDACRAPCDVQHSACDAPCEPLCVLPRDVCIASRGAYHFNPQNRLFQGCAGAGCHGQAAPDQISMGLDLTTELSVLDTAVGRTAYQTQQGQDSVSPDQTPLRFGRAMPRIDPGNPGNSYLIYKLLINPLNHPNDGDQLEPQLASAVFQLRESIVVGLPMPAALGAPTGLVPRNLATREGDLTGEQSFARLQLLSQWIAHGAVLDCSPSAPGP